MARLHAAAVALLVASLPIATSAQAWEPAGKWTVDDGEEFCTLSRLLSRDGAALTFSFPSPLTGAGGTIALAPLPAADQPRAGGVAVTLLPAAESFPPRGGC